MTEISPEAKPIPRFYLEAIRDAIARDCPDLIAVVVLKGSKESGLLGLYSSGFLPEDETLQLLRYATDPDAPVLAEHVED